MPASMTPTRMLSSLARTLAPTPLLKLPERIASKLPRGGAEPPEHLVHGVRVPIRRPEHDLVLGVGPDGQRLPRLDSQPPADCHRDHNLPLGAHADDRPIPAPSSKSIMAYIVWRSIPQDSVASCLSEPALYTHHRADSPGGSGKERQSLRG